MRSSKKVPKLQHVAPIRLLCKGIHWGAADVELTALFSSTAPCRAAYAIKDEVGSTRDLDSSGYI